MPSFEDYDDMAGSEAGSSDNELDEQNEMEDNVEADVQGDEDEGSESGSDSSSSDTDAQTNAQAAQPAFDGVSIPEVRPEALTATTYDIAPTIAAPQSTSINAITATADTRWVFSGGSDGYIRKFNWVDTVNSKLMLTVAQRHPFVDSVVKAGVLMTYWENWDISPRRDGQGERVLSPVYSLAVQNQGLWLLSGQESGSIRLQSIRHEEGKQLALLQQHKSAVSVLSLAGDERSLLSGSWDKHVFDWDLNEGKVRRAFTSTAGQISAIERRPMSSLPVPEESGELPTTNGTFSTNNANGETLVNGTSSRQASQPPRPAQASPDSLFGDQDDGDDLFGDSAAVTTNGNFLEDADGEEDDIFSKTVTEPAPGAATDAEGDTAMDDGNVTAAERLTNGTTYETTAPSSSPAQPHQEQQDHQQPNGTSTPLANGLPHSEDTPDKAQDHKRPAPAPSTSRNNSTVETDPPPQTSDTTFLATSIDGLIRIWDRRAASPIARVIPRNTPPWCMSACWSPSGNHIYAGRRNCTVEEYDLRGGLKGPSRVFKFPLGSGAVTSVRAMPNGRGLVCASHDILRLYDLKQEREMERERDNRSKVPFLIVPGHRTGVVSSLYVDPACRFMISTGGNRGWEGSSTEVLLGYEIGCA